MSNLVVDQTNPALDQELIGKIIRLEHTSRGTPTKVVRFGKVSGVSVETDYHGRIFAIIYFVDTNASAIFATQDKEQPYKVTTFKPRRIVREKDEPVHF